jgi:hypothetical protein
MCSMPHWLASIGQDRRRTMIGRSSLAHSRWLTVLLAMALGAMGLPAMVSAAPSTTEVSVSAPTGALAPGQQFTVNIAVVPSKAIAGVQFDLVFDASLTAVSTIEEGDLLNQGGASSFFNSGTIDNQAGNITGVFGAITNPGATVSTPGTFATISFTAKTQSGTCPLSLSNVVVGDVDGNAVTLSVVDGTVSINRPPVLKAIGNKSVNEGSALSFTISASDADDDTLTYSASNLPAGATFNATTRNFSWTPGYSQAGVYAGVRFQVSDGQMTDYEDITVTVGNVLRSDVNDDGSVNVLDMIMIGQHWSETGAGGWIREDVNEDGTVNVLDATLIGQNWTG